MPVTPVPEVIVPYAVTSIELFTDCAMAVASLVTLIPELLDVILSPLEVMNADFPGVVKALIP